MSKSRNTSKPTRSPFGFKRPRSGEVDVKTFNLKLALQNQRNGETEMKTFNPTFQRKSNAVNPEPPLSKGGWGVEVAIAN